MFTSHIITVLPETATLAIGTAAPQRIVHLRGPALIFRPRPRHPPILRSPFIDRKGSLPNPRRNARTRHSRLPTPYSRPAPSRSAPAASPFVPLPLPPPCSSPRNHLPDYQYTIDISLSATLPPPPKEPQHHHRHQHASLARCRANDGANDTESPVPAAGRLDQ